MSNARTSDPGQQSPGKKQPVSFEIGNAKDWAPTEILSRSEVYAHKPVTDSDSFTIEKGSDTVQHQQLQVFASLQQSINKEGLAELGPFIKVSNMVLDTKSVSSAEESNAGEALKFMA